MPSGQPPSARAAARYAMLDRQLDRLEKREGKDYSTFSAIRRKIKEWLGTDDGQLVTTQKRMTLLKKTRKMEEEMRRRGNKMSLADIAKEQSK